MAIEFNAQNAIANCALDMHNKFLDTLKEPRSVHPIDLNVSRDELLKTTYIRLLETAKELIDAEIEAARMVTL